MGCQLNGKSMRLRTVRQGFDSLTSYHLIFIKKYDIIFIQSKDRYSNYIDNALGAGCCRFESYSPRRYGEIAQWQSAVKYRKTCLVYGGVAQLAQSTRLIIARSVVRAHPPLPASALRRDDYKIGSSLIMKQHFPATLGMLWSLIEGCAVSTQWRRRNLKENAQYPGLAQLGERVIWDHEAARSSRATWTRCWHTPITPLCFV